MVTKLVIPAAGLGKRLLPLTATTPKNLLPLCGRPILEYVLQETAGTAITDVILVVGPQHEEDFKTYIQEARPRFSHLTFHVRIQKKPYGNGHALIQAYDFVKGEPFAVRFPDDILCGGTSALMLLLDHFGRRKKTIMMLEAVSPHEVTRYGVVRHEAVPGEQGFFKINGVVEKPALGEAPSNLIIVGAYVLTQEILHHLKQLEKDMAEREDALWLVDGFVAELQAGGVIYGLQFSGKRLDCGTIDGLQAAEAFIAEHPEFQLPRLQT